MDQPPKNQSQTSRGLWKSLQQLWKGQGQQGCRVLGWKSNQGIFKTIRLLFTNLATPLWQENRKENCCNWEKRRWDWGQPNYNQLINQYMTIKALTQLRDNLKTCLNHCEGWNFCFACLNLVIFNSSTDLKRIRTPHCPHCFWDFGEDKTFTTCWSGCRVYV